MVFRTLVFLLAATLVAGQSTDAVCMPRWTWASNSRGQNPCLVSAYIIGVCQSGYRIPALPSSDYWYTGPWKYEDNYCQCSTVTFSLVNACALCQNGTTLSWSIWSTNCSTIYPEKYIGEIPSGTSIPAWAYLDVVSLDRFDPYRAEQAAGLPESSATSFRPTGTALSATTPTPTDNPSKKKSNVGPIVGGVVGGLVGLGLIVAFIVTMICVIRRRRQRAHTTPSTYPTGYLNSPQMASTPQYDPNRVSHVPPLSPQRHYDPADPSTFPTTPLTPNTVYTTVPPLPILPILG